MWSSLAILDWDSWLHHLWQEHAFSSSDAPLLLTALQEHVLWLRAQQSDAHLVVWPDGLASLAQSAYHRLSKYELHKERNTTWFEPDAEHFRQWAKLFDHLCHQSNWSSSSRMEALIIEAAQSGSLILPKQILLVGFDRFTPAQESLLQSCRENGMTAEIATPQISHALSHELVSATDARDELLTCAQWCRYKLKTTPEIQIGVIAPDVNNIRAEAEHIFRSVLMPQSLDLANEPGTMPFEFSLGMPISTVPVVRAALLLLRWINNPLLEEDVTWLSLSGFFHEDRAETPDLAQLDFKRRDSGALSPEISLSLFSKGRAQSLLARRLQQLIKYAEERQAQTANRTYTQWSELAQHVLQLAAWPGFRSPDSVQFQAQKRWQRLLDEIALLDFAERKVTFATFLDTLDRHADETTFIPESHNAPIQILGAFESSGQEFDAIWFLGVDDTHWPPTGRLHPLLPVALQRRTKMPHCDTATDTDLALSATRRIANSAPECIFSYARQNKEGELRPSPILAALHGDTMREVAAADLRKELGIADQITPILQAESAIVSSQITPWPVDRVAGGAEVLKDQAACPFRAFAKRRFATQPLNRTTWGLDASQRGKLLHSVLEAVWSPETAEQFRMVSLDDLRNVIAERRLDEALQYHITNVFEKLLREHAEDSWMTSYLESEKHRLLVRLRDWLTTFEAKRHPFTVEKREVKLENVNVGDLKLNLRADRIDLLPDGSHLLIDYKTGEVSASAWTGGRPDEPQLPLYTVYGNVNSVIGLLFAQIRAGKMDFVGRIENAQQNLLPSLPATKSLVNQPYDKPMHDEWQHALLQLADEFLHGEASVDPKRRTETCTYCPLPGLCRVAEAGLANEREDAEAGYA